MFESEARFDWDPAKAAINLRKHKVSFDLAKSVFRTRILTWIHDEDYSDFEERWITMGFAQNGQLLVVSHTLTEISGGKSLVRLISARTATPNERRQYELSE